MSAGYEPRIKQNKQFCKKKCTISAPLDYTAKFGASPQEQIFILMWSSA